MFGIGGWELLVIAVVALIVLGPKGLPAVARAVGRAVSELRRATNDLRQSIELDPDLKEIPHALDELNRPLLSPSPYSRKRPPRDGPPEDLAAPPRAVRPGDPRTPATADAATRPPAKGQPSPTSGAAGAQPAANGEPPAQSSADPPPHDDAAEERET